MTDLTTHTKGTNMSIVVTGATGHLGRLVVTSLLERGTAPQQILATGRNAEKLAQLAAQTGVRTAVVDFVAPASVSAALREGDTVLLVSTSEMGQRVAQHGNVITAAKTAGVARIVYTSAPHADTSALVLAPEHKATEELIAASGLPYTILRNGWYHENYVPAIEQARATGVLAASVGDGLVASASRADYAEAAAVVLTEPGHEGRVYELSGDAAWNYETLAQAISDVIGSPVEYLRVTPEDQRQGLLDAGVDAQTAGFLVALDADIRAGLIAETTGELSELIDRPTTALAEGLRAAIA